MKIASRLPKPRYHESVKNRYYSYVRKLDTKIEAIANDDSGIREDLLVDVETDELDSLPAELDSKTFKLNCLEAIAIDRKKNLVKDLKRLVKTRKRNNSILSSEIEALAIKIQFEEPKN